MTAYISQFKRIALSFAGVATIAAAAGCGGKAATSKADSGPPPVPVSAAPIRQGAIESTYTLTGTIIAGQQANMSSVVSGQVRAVNVQIGDRVNKGELLVQIDDSSLRATLAQNEAALAAAQARLRSTVANNTGSASTTEAGLSSAQVAFDAAASNLKRTQSLFKQGYVSQSAMDQATSQYAAAQSALRSAQVAAQNANMSNGSASSALADVAGLRASAAQDAAAVQFTVTQIDQAAVTAPFDGVVTQRSVDPGSLASPGTPLVQVSAMDPAFVAVGIPDSDLGSVSTGTAATVTVASIPGRKWTGKVANLNAATNAGTLSYLARIAIPNPQLALKAGMVANAAFVAARHPHALIVPRTAIAATQDGSAVYFVEKGKAKLVAVTVGLQTQDQAEVSGAGISAGKTVITQRPDSLQDGSAVQIVTSLAGAGPSSAPSSP
ncbi:MAG TPA: efflux RND transporter periplasmic adaptor subunit [Candidatus Eremiobacteraceae bacterium]|nr:efflux RND transporter periplasmic adaptor subunit [Candidatus Eremiobacteraceae bacterium]